MLNSTHYCVGGQRRFRYLWLTVAWLTGVWLAVACTQTSPSPIAVDFARLRQGEPLVLRVGDSFALIGYLPQMISLDADGVVEIQTTTPSTTSGLPQQTVLRAASRGQTEVTISQTLCEGVATCQGPTLFFRLQVEVE